MKSELIPVVVICVAVAALLVRAIVRHAIRRRYGCSRCGSLHLKVVKWRHVWVCTNPRGNQNGFTCPAWDLGSPEIVVAP